MSRAGPMDGGYPLFKRGYVVAFVAVGLQILLVGLATWILIDMKPQGGDLKYTWLGVLVPVVLILIHSATLCLLRRTSKRDHPRLGGLVLSSLLPMACVGLWWLLFAVAESQHWPGGGRADVYQWFLASGLLPPRSLIALKWMGALCLLTLAALLGLVPLGVALRIAARARKRRRQRRP